MKQINVGKHHYALVDDDDYEMLRRYKWHMHNGYARNCLIGRFKSAREAAFAYDRAALKFHGQFARTNILVS